PAALLEGESAHSRAAVEAQRARDRLDMLWERAAADDIDIETTAQGAAEPASEASPLLPGRSAPQPADFAEGNEPEDLQSKIEQLKSKIHRLGVVNPLALEEYEEAAARHTFLTTQSDDLLRAEVSLRELIAELDGAMRMRFETT